MVSSKPIELEGAIALIAQHFEHCRSALFGHFDARVFHAHDVHLQRLHEEILIVPAVRAGQGH